MEAVISQEEQALRTELAQARERLEDLARSLESIDAELEGLSAERQQYAVLDEVCGGLEALGELGAAGLFWGAAQAEGAERIQVARGRLKAFQGRVDEIEARRQAVVDEIGRQKVTAEVIEDNVFAARIREEYRKLEWVVEREMGALPDRPPVMPWARGGEDDRRFRKTLAWALSISLLLGALLPLIDLPLPEPWEPIEVPDRLARLIREERPLPPPPPPREAPAPEEVETDPQVAEEKAPEPKPKPRAESQGILAFREKFSGLAQQVSAARLGSQARISSSAEAPSGRPARSMVTTQGPGSSGGINLASLSRDVGGGGGSIDGVQVVRATSTIGGGGGGGTSDRPLSGGPAAGRTDEEIQIVFDRHKAALYRLYNRELRRDPTLQGQMVLRLRIEPDGSVSLCELQATDMKAPQLSAQVVARVRTFDFGAKEGVSAVTILYPIDFLPAT